MSSSLSVAKWTTKLLRFVHRSKQKKNSATAVVAVYRNFDLLLFIGTATLLAYLDKRFRYIVQCA